MRVVFYFPKALYQNRKRYYEKITKSRRNNRQKQGYLQCCLWHRPFTAVTLGLAEETGEVAATGAEITYSLTNLAYPPTFGRADEKVENLLPWAVEGE